MALIESKIEGLLQYRIVQEEQSSRLYKSMSVWLEFNGYLGASKLYQKYSDEELKHADWTYKYLMALNIKPVVPSQQLPQGDFKGLSQIIALSYQHEVDITEQCKELTRLAQVESDFLTHQLGLKYITEQVEELGKIQTLLDMLESFGTDKIALRLLDERMGEM